MARAATLSGATRGTNVAIRWAIESPFSYATSSHSRQARTERWSSFNLLIRSATAPEPPANITGAGPVPFLVLFIFIFFGFFMQVAWAYLLGQTLPCNRGLMPPEMKSIYQTLAKKSSVF
jgi:hypothetical protein